MQEADFQPVTPDSAPAQAGPSIPAIRNEAFFTRTDWTSFAVTATAALVLYLVTLTPDVTLGFSGIFATGGLYAGVAHPPGYPLATLWWWMFIHLLPFGNIAWRVAVSSAVAGALASGVIALMVSRGGAMLREGELSKLLLDTRAGHRIRIAGGFAAGLVFGANGPFWQRAVIADVWTLSILLLCLVLCLLLRWLHRPERRRYFYAAAFAYGLALTNSQIQLALAPAIPFLLWAGNRQLARDLFLAGGILFVAALCGVFRGPLSQFGIELSREQPHLKLLVIVGTITTGCGIGLAILTRCAFSEWKSVLAGAALFLLGLSLYFYVPIASMTNPPMNWGYARTVPGFFHVLTRGQYERIRPTDNLAAFAKQSRAYATVSAKEFGWPYLAFVLAPFLFLRRVSARGRRWVLALFAAYVCLAFLILAVLNPALDRTSLEHIKVFFSASYVVLALWLGLGLVLLGTRFVKPDNPPPP